MAADYAAAAQQEDPLMQVMLVLDTSGSMKYTDPENMTAQAASLFLDMMRNDRAQAGLTVFNDVVDTCFSMTDLVIGEGREQIKEQIMSLQRGGDTDIGAALMEAVSIISDEGSEFNESSENRAENRERIILFFTDGCVDLPHAKDQEAAEAKSLARAYEAAQTAKERGIRFFVVGLDGSEKEGKFDLDQQLCEELAQRSDGAWYLVQDAGQLPEIFDQIFADFIEVQQQYIGELTLSDGEAGSDMEFEIPDSSVLEANIILLTDSQLSRVSLDSPSGSDTTGKVLTSYSDRYTLLKLLNPEPGIWNLHIAGNEECTVHVSLLCNYDIELTASAAEDDEGNAYIQAYFTRDGEALLDEDLYRQFTCIAKVNEAEEGLADAKYPEAAQAEAERLATTLSDAVSQDNREYPMEMENGVFSTVIPVWPGKTIAVTVSAAGERLARDSEMLFFTNSRSDAIIEKGLPKSMEIQAFWAKDAETVIHLPDYFQAWDGSDLTYECSCKQDILSAVILNEDLHIHGNDNGLSRVTLKVQDAYGRMVRAVIDIQVVIQSRSTLPVVITVILLMIAVAAILVIVRLAMQKRPLAGYLYMEIMDMNKTGMNDGRNRDIQLCADLDRLSGSSAFSSFPGISDMQATDLDQVMISGWKYGVRIYSRKRRVNISMTDCYGNTVRKLCLRDGDTFELRFASGSRECLITGYYSLEPEENDE